MVASAAGPMFLKAIDASHITKDVEYIAKVFTEVVEEIGPANIFQIVTDNGSNFKAAGALIETKYPRIFWTPCVVHCLNLAIKSICDPNEKSRDYAQCEWIKELVTQDHDISYFILNHSLPRTIFSRYSDVKLLKVAETRFASNIIMLTRIRRVREALEKTVMDPDWKKTRGSLGNAIELKSREIKDTLVSDTWWDKIDYFLRFTEPILRFLKVADSDSCVLHLVYDMWDAMIEEIKSCIFYQENEDLLTGYQLDFFDVVQKIIEDRWNRSNTPLHCLAHSLVPKYYSQQWLQRSAHGVRRPHLMASRDDEDPLSWWANYGSFRPLLQGLAFRLLSQPATSSCCERNWSTYGSIRNVKRNRLTTQRTEDLVNVHNNVRIVSRKQPEYTSDPCKFWDIGGDTADGDSILEIADLSLNDPEIEAVTFDVDNKS
ncbi:uncharacterized protein LOC108219637 [Daucus carota subsp. sativus]|uniref:uncharacterized protein LOC108219637 n=1 Tax=Daucus carota subsp. sativus TaxID=79200 RepID=UPI0007EFFC39|nr:PREDICTED: uncharacterized protein LOC108219637 [Daucus carota subsp. sativus]